MGFFDFLFGGKEEKRDAVLEEDKVLEPRARITVYKAPTDENKVMAIKAIREHTGVDLKTAKTLSETLPQTLEVWKPEIFAGKMQKLGYPVKGDFDGEILGASQHPAYAGGGAFLLQIEENGSAGDKIGAIKGIREYTGCDLRTAKEIIENLPQIVRITKDWAFIEEMNRCGYHVKRIKKEEV